MNLCRPALECSFFETQCNKQNKTSRVNTDRCSRVIVTNISVPTTSTVEVFSYFQRIRNNDTWMFSAATLYHVINISYSRQNTNEVNSSTKSSTYLLYRLISDRPSVNSYSNEIYEWVKQFANDRHYLSYKVTLSVILCHWYWWWTSSSSSSPRRLTTW